MNGTHALLQEERDTYWRLYEKNAASGADNRYVKPIPEEGLGYDAKKRIRDGRETVDYVPNAHMRFKIFGPAVMDYVNRDNKRIAFTDMGNRVVMKGRNDEMDLLQALRLAAGKWPEGVRVTGTIEFKQSICRLAAEHGIKITNPELQPMLQKFRESGNELAGASRVIQELPPERTVTLSVPLPESYLQRLRLQSAFNGDDLLGVVQEALKDGIERYDLDTVQQVADQLREKADELGKEQGLSVEKAQKPEFNRAYENLTAVSVDASSRLLITSQEVLADEGKSKVYMVHPLEEGMKVKEGDIIEIRYDSEGRAQLVNKTELEKRSEDRRARDLEDDLKRMQDTDMEMEKRGVLQPEGDGTFTGRIVGTGVDKVYVELKQGDGRPGRIVAMDKRSVFAMAGKLENMTELTVSMEGGSIAMLEIGETVEEEHIL